MHFNVSKNDTETFLDQYFNFKSSFLIETLRMDLLLKHNVTTVLNGYCFPAVVSIVINNDENTKELS